MRECARRFGDPVLSGVDRASAARAPEPTRIGDHPLRPHGRPVTRYKNKVKGASMAPQDPALRGRFPCPRHAGLSECRGQTGGLGNRVPFALSDPKDPEPFPISVAQRKPSLLGQHWMRRQARPGLACEYATSSDRDACAQSAGATRLPTVPTLLRIGNEALWLLKCRVVHESAVAAIGKWPKPVLAPRSPLSPKT